MQIMFSRIWQPGDREICPAKPIKNLENLKRLFENLRADSISGNDRDFTSFDRSLNGFTP